METGRDRRPVMVVLAVVAVLLAGLLLTSGGDADDGDEAAEAAETSTSTTRRRSSTTRRDRSSTTRRSTTTTIPPPIADQPVGARLAVLRDGALSFVDIDADTTVTVEAEELTGVARPAPMLTVPLARRGDVLVFQGRDGTYVTSPREPGGHRLLGPSVLFVPGVAEDEVWTVEPPDGASATVRRWRVDGAALGPSRQLPVDWVPFAAVEGGLVLQRGDRFQVWDPESGAASAVSDTSVSIVAAAGRLVAWHVHCQAPLCSMHLTDTVTGEDRPFFLGDIQLDWGGGSFSPDGRVLVAFGHRVENPNMWRQGLVLIDVATGAAEFLEAPRGDLYEAATAWSADGAWLFVLPNADPANRQVLAYSVATGSFTDVRLPRGAGGWALAAY